MVTTNGDSKANINSAPPPTYAQVVVGDAGPAQPHAQSQPPPPNAQGHPSTPYAQPVTPLLSNSSLPPQQGYGPTPMGAQVGVVLPYYDPRSSWALEEAAGRARRRFFEALFWALVLYLAMGGLVGGMVTDARYRRHHGSWAAE